MIEAAEAALDFISDRHRVDLDTDIKLRFALVRAIEIIGEATSKLSKEARADTPEVPWSRIVSMRNRLIHASFDIDREILWNTATKELPVLLTQLRALIGKE